MATYNQGVDKTFLADVDISASQYYFVVNASTAGYVKISSTAAGSVLGVLQNDPEAGQEAVVRVSGFTKVRANAGTSGSVIAYMQKVKSGSDGMAWGSLNQAASTYDAGYAQEALASGSGAYIQILFVPGMRY